MALNYLLEKKKLPQGVNKKDFYKYFLKHLKVADSTIGFEEFNKIMDILPMQDQNILELYLAYFYRANFKDFFAFLNILNSNENLKGLINSSEVREYVNSRIKYLKKEDFITFSQDEIEYYENFAKDNPSRTILIKLGDIYFEKDNLDKALYYYQSVIKIRQDHDKLYKSILRKLSHIYGMMEIIPESLYYIALLHKIDLSHKVAEEELKKSLKHHHLSSYYSEIMSRTEQGLENFVEYIKTIFNDRNLKIK
jgi:tetratricopeptide (TPR) repeat protein